jgi:hypothetical protein
LYNQSEVLLLNNLLTYKKFQPIVILQERKYFIWFIKANFNFEFFDTIIIGKNKNIKSTVKIFSKYQLNSAYISYILFKKREKAGFWNTL